MFKNSFRMSDHKALITWMSFNTNPSGDYWLWIHCHCCNPSWNKWRLQCFSNPHFRQLKKSIFSEKIRLLLPKVLDYQLIWFLLTGEYEILTLFANRQIKKSRRLWIFRMTPTTSYNRDIYCRLYHSSISQFSYGIFGSPRIL